MPEPLPRYPLSRYAARFSIVAPMAAFLLSCLAQSAVGGVDSYGDALGGWLKILVGCVMCLLIAGGLALGVIGLWGANKTDDSQTRLLALLGITLSVSAILLIAFTMWIVFTSRSGPGASLSF